LIIFNFNGVQCIGRTLVASGQNLVGMLTIEGKIGHILFEEIFEPKKLNIKTTIPEKKQSFDEQIKQSSFVLGEA
jgi:hypothetical protein